MELIYLWIDGYKNLKDTGIILNPAYEEDFIQKNIEDKNIKQIILKEKKNYVNIFGNNLNVITLVGKNGSGKSNVINALSLILRNISLCHNTKFYDENEYDNNSIPQNCKFCLITKVDEKFIAYCSDKYINDIEITLITKAKKNVKAIYFDNINSQNKFEKCRICQSKFKINNVAKFQPFYRKDDTTPVDFTRWKGIDDITKIKLNNYFYYDRFRLYDTVRNLIELYNFNKTTSLKIFENENTKLQFNKYSPYIDIYDALDWTYNRIKHNMTNLEDGTFPLVSALGEDINRIMIRIKNKSILKKNIKDISEEVLPKLFLGYALGEVFNLIKNYEIEGTLLYLIKDTIGMKIDNSTNIKTNFNVKIDSNTRKSIYKKLKRILFAKRPIKDGLLPVNSSLPNDYATKRLEEMLDSYITYEEDEKLKNFLEENYDFIDGKIIQLKEPVEFSNRHVPYIKDIEDLKGISKNLYLKNENSFYDFMSLSTGEQRLLRFFADLYYCASKLNDDFETNVFLFDEMDLSWHPEWQRKMISYIKDLFDKISQNDNRKFNLIFTTHSPFILSDMTKDNVLYMENGKNVTQEITQKFNLQPFGANIHDLFNCGLFFDCDNCNTMGEFAKSEIIRIKNDLENNEKITDNSIKDRINLIGEPIIRNILLEKLQENNILNDEFSNDYRTLQKQNLELKRKLIEYKKKYEKN